MIFDPVVMTRMQQIAFTILWMFLIFWEKISGDSKKHHAFSKGAVFPHSRMPGQHGQRDSPDSKALFVNMISEIGDGAGFSDNSLRKEQRPYG